MPVILPIIDNINEYGTLYYILYFCRERPNKHLNFDKWYQKSAKWLKS